MCCEASWKREIVPDHKFDFLNVTEFRKTDVLTRLSYIFRYIFLLKSIAVYGLDIFTAVTMLASGHWTNAIQAKCGDNCAVEVQFGIAKWVFVGCIIFSFLLLGYELYKAKKVIDSRDISYAFTNLMANDYYAFKSYDNHCLFSQISSSTKKKDDFAFWIFFTFKDWKRLLLADGPRQSINALTLYSFAAANGFQTQNIPAYWDNSPITAMLLFSIIATVAIFICSLVLLVAAAILYVPLLCYIQGNLKEYVCHKVDKRITELVKKNHRHRAQRQAALEKRLASDALKGKKNDAYAGRIMQPTLPDVKLDDDDLSMEEAGWRSGKSSVEGHGLDGVSTLDYDYPGYPPRKNYNRPYGAAARYPDEYGSSTNLAAAAAPMGLSYPPPAASVMPPPLSTQSSYANLPPPRSAPPPSAPPSSYGLAGPVFPPSRSQTSLSAWSNPPQAAPAPYSQPPASRPITPSPPQHYGYPPATPSDYPAPQRGYSRDPVMAFPAPLPSSSSRQTLAVSQDPYRHQGETVLSPSSISSHTVQSGYMDTRRGSGTSLGINRAVGGGNGGAGWQDYGRDVMQRRRSDLGGGVDQDDDDAGSGLAYDQLDSQEPAPRYSPVDHVPPSGYGKR